MSNTNEIPQNFIKDDKGDLDSNSSDIMDLNVKKDNFYYKSSIFLSLFSIIVIIITILIRLITHKVNNYNYTTSYINQTVILFIFLCKQLNNKYSD